MVGLLHCGSVPISVTIKDTSGAGRVVTSVTLDGINDRITLRDLVRTRVREEVARYNAARGEELWLTADSDIRFIRLVQLVGG